MISWIKGAAASGGWLVALAALVGGALLAGWLRAEFWPSKPIVKEHVVTETIEAEPKVVERVRTEIVRVPVEVRVPSEEEATELEEETGFDQDDTITEEDRERERETGIPARGFRLLGIREVPKAPYGGKAEVALEGESGEMRFRFRKHERPFMELLGRRYVGGGIIYDGVSEEPVGGHASVRLDALRFHRTELGARGGVKVLGGDIEPYAEVSLWWSF